MHIIQNKTKNNNSKKKKTKTVGTVFHRQAQQENIRDRNFYFPKYSISLSKSGIDRIGKLGSVGK